METAYKQYLQFEEQLEAFEESFRINEVRFTNGAFNFVEYIISKNNVDNSRIRIANAKYKYLLTVQMLEYFRGNMEVLYWSNNQ